MTTTTTTNETRWLDTIEANIANNEYKAISYGDLSREIDYLENTIRDVVEDVEHFKKLVRSEIRNENWDKVTPLVVIVNKHQLEESRIREILRCYYDRAIELHNQGRVGA